jgi:hypothetical protein
MADETVRLVLDVTGVQDIEALKKEMLALTTAMGATDAALEVLGKEAVDAAQKLDKLEDATRDVGKEAVDTTQKLDKLEDATRDAGEEAVDAAQKLDKLEDAERDVGKEAVDAAQKLDKLEDAERNVGKEAVDAAKKLDNLEDAATKAAGSGKGSGRGILQLSWAMQDLFQGGFSAILNNLPGLAAEFGMSAAAAGTLGLAGLGISQAFSMLGPMFTDTEKKLKPLTESWKDFTNGLSGSDKLAVEEMEVAVQKLAANFSAGWLSRLGDLNKQFEEFLSLAREAEALRKETERDAADRKGGQDKIDSLALDKERGKQYEEFMTGQGEDGAKARQDKLAKDMLEKARQEQINERVAAQKRNGEFESGWWDQLNGEYLSPEFLEKLARGQADRETKIDSPEVQKRAESMAAGTMNAAARGDKKALAQIAAADKEFADYEAEVAADKEAEKVHQRWREQRIEREKREMAENKEQQRLAGIGPPEQAFRNNIAAQRQAEERVAAQEALKKKTEAEVEKKKNEALEAGRKKRLDNFMEQEGLTPEGLAQQQEQAAARMPNGRMRQEARDRVAGAQAAELRARMARRGMDENEQAAGLRDIGNAGRQRVPQRRGMRSVAPAAPAPDGDGKASQEVDKGTKAVEQSGDKMVKAVVTNAQVTAKKFQQIEATMLELSRMMAQNMAGQVGGAGWQGGRVRN